MPIFKAPVAVAAVAAIFSNLFLSFNGDREIIYALLQSVPVGVPRPQTSVWFTPFPSNEIFYFNFYNKSLNFIYYYFCYIIFKLTNLEIDILIVFIWPNYISKNL